jgi:hypothetical protein
MLPGKISQLLMSRDSSKRREKIEDEVALLQQIQDADSAAGEQFLEHLVLHKRGTVREKSIYPPKSPAEPMHLNLIVVDSRITHAACHDLRQAVVRFSRHRICFEAVASQR